MRWIKISLHYQEETNEPKNNAGHSFEGLEYLRSLITDLNSFEFPSLIWPNFKAYALARYFQEVRRGKELSDFMRLSIVLDPAIIACPLKRKSRSSLLIMISCSTLAMQLLFHSLKTIKAVQNNGKTQKQYKNHMFNLSLLGCIWKIPNKK